MQAKKKVKSSIFDRLAILGVFLAIGGGVLAVWKPREGIFLAGIGVLSVLVGMIPSIQKDIRKLVNLRKSHPEIYGSFWQSVFSPQLFLKDVSKSFKKKKWWFFFSVFYALILSCITIGLFVKTVSEGRLIMTFLGAVFLTCSLVFSCLLARGSGLVLIAERDSKEGVRGDRSCILGMFGVITSIVLAGLLSS